MIYRFTVGRLSCAVISDGQMMPPWEPPLAAFFTPAAGVPAAVVFTHLHQDHCRGATWSGELTFPQATGFAQAAEVAFWSGAQAAGGAADEHLGSAREAIRLFGARLRPFGYDTEILSGVRVVDAAGHTPGHSAVLLHSDGERLLCVGDLFYDPLQLSQPQWCTPWDHDPVRAVRARRRLLDRAADEHLLVHAYHMPFPGLGTIARYSHAYRWQPLRHDDP